MVLAASLPMMTSAPPPPSMPILPMRVTPVKSSVSSVQSPRDARQPVAPVASMTSIPLELSKPARPMSIGPFIGANGVDAGGAAVGIGVEAGKTDQPPAYCR